MKRFFFTLLAIPCAILLGGLSGSYSASAASPYDNAYVSTDKIYLGSNRYGNSCTQEEVTTSFWDIINNSAYWVDSNAHNTFLSEWEGAEHQAFHISNARNGTDGSNYHWQITLTYWDSDEDIVINWQDYYSTTPLDTSSSHTVRTLTISTGSNCDPSITLSNTGNSSYITSVYAFEPYSYTHNWLVNKYDFNLPVDYEGEMPNNTIPVVPRNDVPDWYPVTAVDWEVIIADENFFTTDMKYPFLCEDELAPSIIVEIYEGDDASGTLLDSGEFPASAEYRFKAEKVESEQDFHLRGKYNCGTESLLQFDQWGTANFSIGKDGTLSKAEHILNCFSDEFPFINIPDCFAEINHFMAMLAFKVPDEKTVVKGAFTNLQTGCRELQVFDDWLHLQNATVCPMFPSNIRNIVTPFITFLLGLLTVTFIYKRQGIRSVD